MVIEQAKLALHKEFHNLNRPYPPSGVGIGSFTGLSGRGCRKASSKDLGWDEGERIRYRREGILLV